MSQLRFDFNNMFSSSIGKEHGVTDTEVRKWAPRVRAAHKHLSTLAADPASRVAIGLEWMNLPYQDASTLRGIAALGDEVASSYENVISLGIGGSFLGLRAAQDALKPPYYNEFPALRGGRPRVYFEGNNLDPQPLHALLQNLDPAKTCVVVISKSGETTETKAAFSVIKGWLKKTSGKSFGRQIIAITDPERGSLRKEIEEQQQKDARSYRNLPLLPGVGGRFSEFNMGLLHLAIIGVSVAEVLAGCRHMARRCSDPDPFRNPASMYALLQTILFKTRGKAIGMIMPFAETLRSTGDWYCQLLGESTGKKFGRRVVRIDGVERWEADVQRPVNTGRTPVATRGTNDLHSIQQNNIDGRNDKTVTFIRVEHFTPDIGIAKADALLNGRKYSSLLSLAQEATAWALVKESRPNCTIRMPEITPFHWGALLFFFQLATAIEGELLDINAFDQPGVEGYKNYMYYKLGKPGLSDKVKKEIQKRPLIEKERYIL